MKNNLKLIVHLALWTIWLCPLFAGWTAQNASAQTRASSFELMEATVPQLQAAFDRDRYLTRPGDDVFRTH